MHWLRRVLTFREESLLVSSEAREHWADGEQTIPDNNVLWKQYEIYVDLYKTYLDIAWKGSVWYFATIGAILTFLFANISKPGSGALVYVLIFVAFVSCGFTTLYLRSVVMLQELAEFFDYILGQLHLTGRPHVEFLQFFSLMTAILSAIVGVASLAILIVYLIR